MSFTKARFEPEAVYGPFDVQFNPVNFKFDKPVSWKEKEDQGQESKLEFQKAQPANITMELVVDTTHDGNDVRTAWVEKFLELTNPVVPDEDDVEKKRPPYVVFRWSSFEFTGVIESVNTTYTMFSQGGSPLRAKISLKLKEWTPKSNYASSGGGGGLNTAKIQLVTVQSGQTLSQLASANNTTQQAILAANPQIQDAMNLAAGMVLAISSSSLF